MSEVASAAADQSNPAAGHLACVRGSFKAQEASLHSNWQEGNHWKIQYEVTSCAMQAQRGGLLWNLP